MDPTRAPVKSLSNSLMKVVKMAARRTKKSYAVAEKAKKAGNVMEVTSN